MVEFWAYRKGNTLVPSEGESAAIFSRLPFSSSVHVEVKKPRSGAQHRLYWLLCQRIGNAVGVEAETVSDLLKIRTGHVTTVQTKRGVERFPKSIAYASMDQTQFQAFFDRCLVVISEEFGIARPDLLAVMEDLIAPSTSPPADEQAA